MRLSTNSLYSFATNRLLDLQSAQAKLQNQITTGKKIASPADDPIGTTRSLALKQAQTINTQFTNNRQSAFTQLSTAEVVLGKATDVMISAQSLLTGAKNGALSNTDRLALAIDLESHLSQLAELANSKDGVGNYLFSGYKTDTPPFLKTATGYSYQGDTSVQSVQVSETRQMPIAETGSQIFQANGQDVFQTLNDIVSLLKTPVSNPTELATLNAGLGDALDGVGRSLDSVLTSRANFGSKLREIESMNDFASAVDLVYSDNLSKLEDLDYNKALSDFTKQQTILEAAQKVFVKTTSLSLFNII